MPLEHPSDHRPSLERVETGRVAYWTDPGLARVGGVIIAFSERGGGVSPAPYAELNLAAHVGDDPLAVDANRALFLDALGIGAYAGRLTTAEQVHGDRVTWVTDVDAGSGARVVDGRPPVASTDALVTCEPRVPLLLFFADCVPVVLVGPGPCVAVVHAGWRGALASLPGSVAEALARRAGVEPSSVTAYVGPHIGACCYEVGDEILSHFVNTFGTVARAESGSLDLGAVVHESLTRVGVRTCSIAHLGACTAQTTERFFSHRAEAGLTGRHGALACILPRD